jgi:hypothetical protein
MKDIKWLIQAQRTTFKINTQKQNEKNPQTYIIKLLKTKDKEKSWKQSEKKALNSLEQE